MKVLAVILVALSVASAAEVGVKKTEKRWAYGSGYGYNDGRYNAYGNNLNGAYNQAYSQYGYGDGAGTTAGYSPYSTGGYGSYGNYGGYGGYNNLGLAGQTSPYSTALGSSGYGSSGYVYNRPATSLGYPNNYYSGLSGSYNSPYYSGASYPNNYNYNGYNSNRYNGYTGNNGYSGYTGNNGYSGYTGNTGYSGYNDGYNSAYKYNNNNYNGYNNGYSNGIYSSNRVIGLPYSQQYNTEGYY